MPCSPQNNRPSAVWYINIGCLCNPDPLTFCAAVFCFFFFNNGAKHQMLKGGKKHPDSCRLSVLMNALNVYRKAEARNWRAECMCEVFFIFIFLYFTFVHVDGDCAEILDVYTHAHTHTSKTKYWYSEGTSTLFVPQWSCHDCAKHSLLNVQDCWRSGWE